MMGITMANTQGEITTTKVIAITGEIGSGKSTALYAFGRMGARFLSQDHLIYEYFGTDIPEDEEVFAIIQKHINEYRKVTPSVPLFVEVHPWVADKGGIKWDYIITVVAGCQLRRQRLAKRGGYPTEDTYYLTDPYGIGIGADHSFMNHKTKIDLWRRLEQFYKGLVPEQLIQQVNWEEKFGCDS